MSIFERSGKFWAYEYAGMGNWLAAEFGKNLLRTSVDLNSLSAQCSLHLNSNWVCGLLSNDSAPDVVQGFFTTIAAFLILKGIYNVAFDIKRPLNVLIPAAFTFGAAVWLESELVDQNTKFLIEDVVAVGMGVLGATALLRGVSKVRQI